MRKLPLFAALMMVLLLFTLPSIAQAPVDEPVQMATGLRSSGKIWVVVAVFIAMLAGFFAYLIRVDRKVSDLEKK